MKPRIQNKPPRSKRPLKHAPMAVFVVFLLVMTGQGSSQMEPIPDEVAQVLGLRDGEWMGLPESARSAAVKQLGQVLSLLPPDHVAAVEAFHPGFTGDPEALLVDLYAGFEAHGGLQSMSPLESVEAMRSIVADSFVESQGIPDPSRVTGEVMAWGWPHISQHAQHLLYTTGVAGELSLPAMESLPPSPTSMEDLQTLSSSSSAPSLEWPGSNSGGPYITIDSECDYRSGSGEMICTTYWITLAIAALVIIIAVIIAAVVILVAALLIAVGITVATLAIALAVFWANFILAKVDDNTDGMGDDWVDYWKDVALEVLAPAVDTDYDKLLNVDEFRWELYPVCADSLPDDADTLLIDESSLSASNCMDYDNDNWEDGPEVDYWNNPENDKYLYGDEIAAAKMAFFDPDRNLNTDDDEIPNIRDPDSDNDSLLDGDEVNIYDTYPEFEDSDCAMFAAQCTLSSDTTYWDQTRLGLPGRGDHINDADELEFWNTVGPDAWRTDWDGDGIWNNLLDPDSDGDGVLDGDEIRAGTNPSDPSDGAQNTIVQNNPTNENLPKALMDPTNLQYLDDGRVDAEEEAEELAAVVDQAISAAIAGNVTEALAVIYEATPLAPLVQSGVETVELAEEALLALVKCVDTDATALADPETTTTDTTQCVSSVFIPFLDALLSRTVEQLPLVGDTVAQLRQETLPGIVDTVDRITPLDLQATSQALLQDPIAAAQQATLDVVDLVSSPENLQGAVAGSQAAIQVEAASLMQASTRHPQFLYDTVLSEGLDTNWHYIQQANDATAGTGIGPVQAIDSLVFNLYTNRDTSERVTSIPVGERTCVQLSSTDTSTRDTNGCDLYATLTVSHSTAYSPGGAPTLGKRVTPSLQLETALPGASFELEALGYLQLPDSPHIMVLGYATTGSGQPQSWTGTLLEYDAHQAWSNRALAYASTYDDARTAIPLHLVAGSFEVEVAVPGKPVVEGEATVLELESAAVPSSVSVDVRRLDVGGERRVEASLDANAAAAWSLLHRDGLGSHESRFQFAAQGLPSGTSRITHTAREVADASWQWSSPATTSALEAAYQELLDDVTVRSFDATSTDVPGMVLLRSDTEAHTHAYQATTAPATLDILMAEGIDACPVLTGRFLVVEQDAASLCVTGSLDGYTALQVQDLDARLHVTGSRSAASIAPTTVLVRDGNTAYAAFSESPASWTGTFTSNPGDVRTLDWSAAAPVAGVTLEADLASELLRVDLTSVPVTVSATLDASRGVGELSAADYVGNLAWVTSTTGNAPSGATLADHVRLRELAAGVEASWSLQGARDVLARVTEDGAWQATGSFSTSRPLELYYEDETHLVQLEAASVSGDFLFRVADDAGRGLFTYQHELAAPVSAVRLAGNLAGNNVLVDLATAPADLSLSTRLDAQSATLTASGTVGSLEAVYAPDGKHPTATRDAFLVVGGTTASLPGLHFKAGGISSLEAVRSPATLQLEAMPALASPLLVRFEQGQDATLLDLATVPTQLTATHGEGLLAWSSSAAATSFDYLARDAGASSYLSASATGAPGSLSASWTPRAVDTFQASVSHSAGNLPELTMEDRRSAAGQSAGDAGFRFTGNDLPAQVSTRFEPTQGHLTATATNAAGAPSAAGFLDVGFGERRASRLQAPSSTGILAFLDETSAGIAGALRATDLESLTVRLFGAEGEPDSAGTVSLQRAASGSVYVRADSESRDAHGVVHYDAAPADVQASLWPGTAAGGFRAESHSPAAAGTLTASLVRDGRSLAATASPTPADLTASWTPGSAVTVTASSPTTVTVQATPQGVSVPGLVFGDHVVAKQSTAGSLFALRLSSVESFRLDPALGVLEASAGGSTSLLVDHAPGAERLRLQADPLPASLAASWSPATRSISVDASGAMSRFLVSTDPGDAGGQRLLGILDGVPAGVTSFSASPSGTFALNTPSALSLARVTSDAGVGAATVLDGSGVRVQASGEQPTFFLNLPGVKRAELVLPAGGAPRLGAPRLELDRGIASSASPAEVRLGLPGQRLMGHLDSLPGGSTALTWPSPASMTFSAVGAPSGVTLGVDAGSDRGQVSLTGGPSSWSLGFTEAGAITYTGSGGASELDAFGAWHGAAFTLAADGVPGSINVNPANGMQSGQVTTGGVGRLKLALASSGGSGAAAVPSVDSSNQDVFSVDTTTGGGLLFVDLPGVQSLSWSLPDGVGRVTGAPLTVDLQRSQASSRAGVVQLVHPDHHSYASFPTGLPAGLDVELARTTAKWSLAMDTAGKDYVFQHQGSEAGSLRVESVGAPGSSTLAFEPRASRALDYVASGGASSLAVQSRWNGGFIDLDLSSAPSKFRVDSGGSTLQAGVVSTLASGSVGRAKLFLVPDASDTANRVNPAWEHLAVEATGKTPYLGLNVAGLSTASWQLPEATGNRPVIGSIDRALGVPGNTWVVLSGPREDVTVRAVDAGSLVSLSVVPSTNTAGNLNPQPLAMDYAGGASRVSTTHIHAETGQLASADITELSGGARIDATGAEPAVIDIDVGGATGIEFGTTDGGTVLHVAVEDPAPRLRAEATRGTCGATTPSQVTVSTLGTGMTGPALVQIGDRSRVPAGVSDHYVYVRCTGEEIGVGIDAPFLGDLEFAPGTCNALGLTGVPIPADTPMPFQFIDTHGEYKANVRSHAGSSGLLDLKLGCAALEYNFQHLTGVPGISNLGFEYLRLADVSGVTGDCIQNQDKCINNIRLIGTDLAAAAVAKFTVDGHESGFELIGSAGGTLSVRLVVEPGPKKNELDLGVRLTMPLEELRFEKTDHNGPLPRLPAPNSILRLDDPEQDTLVVKMEKLTSIDVVIQADWGADYLRATVDYQGNSGRALDFQSVDRECMQQRTQVSNLPSHLALESLKDGGGTKYVRASVSDTPIMSLRSAARLGPNCDPKNVDGLDFFTSLTSIPAGPWEVGYSFGKAGFLGVRSDGGTIGGADVGIATPGRADQYISLHLQKARFYFEYDLDGDTRYEGNPYFVYCDMMSDRINLRARSGAFGFGTQLFHPDVGVGCDQLQVSWKLATMPICTINLSFSCTAIRVPLVRATGNLAVSPEANQVITEILYAGKWYSIPPRLWI